ncbi:nucleotide exchange factor GrpE [Aurantivibrio plasticivorans]
MSDETKSAEIDVEEGVNSEVETAADAEVSTEATEGDLQSEVARLQEELVEAKDQALRAVADAQNAQRRAQQDVEKAHKFGQEKLVTDLLNVVDNLERALAASQGDESEAVKAIVEGVELTLKSLVEALEKNSVEAIDPAGAPFDPQLHQAMTAVANPDLEPNTVMDVFQKGYTLHGRLVRPAMVVVSKAP